MGLHVAHRCFVYRYDEGEDAWSEDENEGEDVNNNNNNTVQEFPELEQQIKGKHDS